MTPKSRTAGRLFLAGFLVLTAMVWSPLGYGSHGPVSRLLEMPSWTVIALTASIVLFALEWLFLFGSRLSLAEDDVAEVLRELDAPRSGSPAAGREGHP